MCGRYDNLIAGEVYGRLFKIRRLPASNFPPRYNIAPADQVPIVRVYPRDGERELIMARWGLIPWWMKAKPKVTHINASAETVHQLLMFWEAFAKRRALIPATGFFERETRADGKQPYRFVHQDLEPFASACLWEFARIDGEDILSATIIVGEPNPLVAPVHDRMPVMLMPGDTSARTSAAPRRTLSRKRLRARRIVKPRSRPSRQTLRKKRLHAFRRVVLHVVDRATNLVGLHQVSVIGLQHRL